MDIVAGGSQHGLGGFFVEKANESGKEIERIFKVDLPETNGMLDVDGAKGRVWAKRS